MLFFEGDYLVLIYYKKHVLEIYLEKLWKNGGFTLLNKTLEPFKLPYIVLLNELRYETKEVYDMFEN